MASERLYTLAYQYRSARLWDKLHEDEFFALRLSNGEIGVCTVGSLSDGSALSLYVGEEGLQSLKKICSVLSESSPAVRWEAAFSDCSLSCEFTQKDALEEEQIAEIQDYAKRHGIRLSGKNRFVITRRHNRNFKSTRLTPEEDGLLCEALSAALEVSQRMKSASDRQNLGFHSCEDCEGTIPLLCSLDDGTWEWSTYLLPPIPEEEYPVPIVEDELLTYRLKRMKKTGKWQCDIILGKTPVLPEDGSPTYIPTLLMISSEELSFPFVTEGVREYRMDYMDLLGQFVEVAEGIKSLPSRVLVSNQRTYLFLRDLCQKLGIKLKQVEKLENFEEAQEILYEYDEKVMMIQSVIQILMECDDEYLETIPSDLREIFKEMDKAGLLPPELSERLKPKQKGRQSKGAWVATSAGNQSFVLNVSIAPNCYRDIRVPGGMTLEELAETILSVFEFDNDHLYAFFMSDKLWDDANGYYCPTEDVIPMADYQSQRTADTVCLDDLSLKPHKKFKFLFDFGDEWCFQCKVLRVLKTKTKGFEVVGSKGKAPMQYPDYDGEFDEDDEPFENSDENDDDK